MHPRPLGPILLTLAACTALLQGCNPPAEPPAAPSRSAAAQPVPPASPSPPLHRTDGGRALERLGVAVRQGPRGATVVAIDLDGPAARSGAQIGDVVISLNGAPITDAQDLERLAAAAPPDSIVLELVRGGERRELTVGMVQEAAGSWNSLGLQVREVPEDTLKALGVGYGIMVIRIRAPADRTRILPGDVIVGVNNTAIHSMEEFNRLVGQSRRAVALLVRRADSDLYIAFDRSAARGGASRGGGLAPRETFRTGREAKGTLLRT